MGKILKIWREILKMLRGEGERERIP